MTLVVLGVDALDPELVDADEHPNLTLSAADAIETIDSAEGEPSTHELWPTIITGLRPDGHGLVLAEDGIAWGHPELSTGSRIANYLLPERLQTPIETCLLTNPSVDTLLCVMAPGSPTN